MPRARPKLHTQAEVVDAALLVVDDVGLEGLTIRGVAAVSGVPTMTLYAYIESKQRLLELMVLEVSARIFAAADRGTWQASLEGLCHHVRAMALAHPAWLALLERRTLPSASDTNHPIVRSLIDAGAPPSSACRAVLEATLMSLGLAQLQLSLVHPKAFWPSSVGAAPPGPIDWDGFFAAAVTRWLTGLEAELQRAAFSSERDGFDDEPAACFAQPGDLGGRGGQSRNGAVERACEQPRPTPRQ
jgi:AcrR family transcriptional regulator